MTGDEKCSNCERGREACEWCHDLELIDYKTICDCGLYDFGAHLFACLERRDKKWVVRQ